MSEVSGLPETVTSVEAIPAADVAVRLSIPKSRVQQLVRDGQLLSIRRDGDT